LFRSELAPEAYFSERIIDVVRPHKNLPVLISRIDQYYPPRGAAPPPPPLPDIAVIEQRNWWPYAGVALASAAIGAAAMFVLG
jgi:ubiquinone biosynthesis protein